MGELNLTAITSEILIFVSIPNASTTRIERILRVHAFEPSGGVTGPIQYRAHGESASVARHDTLRTSREAFRRLEGTPGRPRRGTLAVRARGAASIVDEGVSWAGLAMSVDDYLAGWASSDAVSGGRALQRTPRVREQCSLMQSMVYLRVRRYGRVGKTSSN